jgi:hypothetical protein
MRQFLLGQAPCMAFASHIDRHGALKVTCQERCFQERSFRFILESATVCVGVRSKRDALSRFDLAQDHGSTATRWPKHTSLHRHAIASDAVLGASPFDCAPGEGTRLLSTKLFEAELAALHSLAGKRGGKLISTRYLGSELH